MKNLHFRILKLLMPGICFAFYSFGSTPADTLSASGMKSYFLLKLNLDTDPVDLANYSHSVQFRKQFSDFAVQNSAAIAKLKSAEAKVLNQALLAALNGDFDQSEKGFKQAIATDSVSADKTLLAGIYNLMSQMMQLNKDLTQAAIYQQKVLDIAVELKNPEGIAGAFAQLGRIKSIEAKYPAAEQYLLRMALPAFNRLKDKKGIVICYREIADFYVLQELYSQAKWFYIQSLTQARQINYQPGIVAALIELGELKYDVADYDLAAKDWQEAEQLAINLHDLPVLLKIKYNLARNHKHLGNYTASEKYTRAFEQLKDVLLNPSL